MEKPRTNPNNDTRTIISKDAIISKHTDSKIVARLNGFFNKVGATETIPPTCESNDLYSQLIRAFLNVDRVQRGRVSCHFSVVPIITNVFGGLHGGAVAAVAEMVSIACARTVVGEDKEIFLGELSMTYLSAAPGNAALNVDASVVKSGRNLTVVAVEFRLKESGRMAYSSRAIFFNKPLSSL